MINNCNCKATCNGILIWGFREGANWIPVSSLCKRDWTPTPAAKAYQDLLFTEWWTREVGTTGSNGEIKFNAFFVRHKITVDGMSREVDLHSESGLADVEF